jgi:hypothetical protein
MIIFRGEAKKRSFLPGVSFDFSEMNKTEKEVALLIRETFAMIDERDLAPGWENEILMAGRVATFDGMTLDSVAKIQKEMERSEKIKFSAKDGHSLRFVKRISFTK